MRSLVVGAACLVLGACASAPAPGMHLYPGTEVADWAVIRIHESWWGYTFCGSIPTSWLNITGVIPADQEGAVRAHELKHLEQQKRFPSCQALNDAVENNPRLKVEHEAEAWCASAKWDFEQGRYPSLLMAITAAADRLAWYDFLNGDVAAATREIAAFCLPPK